MTASAEDRLTDLARGWGEAGDRRAIFADCYLVMTGRVHEAIAAEDFVDGDWVSRLLDRFADYYFDAVVAHDSPDAPVRCPTVWTGAFDACKDPRCHPLRALLLGINAHINHDLALALADLLEDWHELDERTRAVRHADHEHVNEIIQATTDEVQREVVARYAPETAILDTVLGPVDEWVFGAVVESFRGQVWIDAMTLVTVPADEREESVLRVGRRAEQVASVLTFGRSSR
ncbi:MAG: DUF5995 family protein [Ornithinibacter sp.]